MSLIKLTKNSKVYIVCPPCKATGGPEDIQILCKTLRDFSIDAKIYYYPRKKLTNIDVISQIIPCV